MSTVTTVRPFEPLTHSYVAEPETIPEARHALVAFLRQGGLAQEQIDAIRLAASEAITNVVRHAYHEPGSGELHLTAAFAGAEVWVLVADDGRGLSPCSDRPGLGI